VYWYSIWYDFARDDAQRFTCSEQSSICIHVHSNLLWLKYVIFFSYRSPWRIREILRMPFLEPLSGEVWCCVPCLIWLKVFSSAMSKSVATLSHRLALKKKTLGVRFWRHSLFAMRCNNKPAPGHLREIQSTGEMNVMCAESLSNDELVSSRCSPKSQRTNTPDTFI
jgi:hypothetical protein